MLEENGIAELNINLIPDIDEKNFRQKLSRMTVDYPERRFTAFLNGFINDKLAVYFINKMIENSIIFDEKTPLKDVDIFKVREIYKMISEWNVKVTDIYGFERSQASSGGIKTELINPDNMNVVGRRELYAIGEATDVLGKCGGYNISYALYSGFLAGRNCLKSK